MTKATYKQIEAIHALRNKGKVSLDVDDIERLTKDEASQILTQAGVGKKNGFQSAYAFSQQVSSGNGGSRESPVSPKGNGGNSVHPNGGDFNAARLGQSANLAVNGRGIDYFLQHKEEFLKRVVEIYRLLGEAEGAIKAPSSFSLFESGSVLVGRR